MDVKVITPDGFFRVFTACAGDPKTLMLDVRSNKDYARKHVLQAYNIRLAANGQALLVRFCAMLAQHALLYSVRPAMQCLVCGASMNANLTWQCSAVI